MIDITVARIWDLPSWSRVVAETRVNEQCLALCGRLFGATPGHVKRPVSKKVTL